MSGGQKKRFVIEPHLPYFLHLSEGPSVKITAVVFGGKNYNLWDFDGKNYNLWERAMRTALKAKNKLVFMDRTMTRPKPNDDEEFSEAHAWDITNSLLCS